jgi:octaprenyl-diphosphate synthase
VGVVVPFDDARSPSESLEPLLDLVNEDLEAINRIILDKAVSDVDLIPQLAHHLIASGGKRLRPMLALASAKLCGYPGSGHIRTASAIEFMHTATLLHDDVVDESDARRGRKTARLIWGNQASVLVGDFLLGQAFRMLVDVGNMQVLKILSNAAAVIAEGEVMQLAAAKNTSTTEDAYLAIIDAKTAALFAGAAESGAAIADRPPQELNALRSYGKNLGIAFQLVDDALDYSGDAMRLGKSVGDDFREGKITLPVILSYRRGSDEERAFWNRTIAAGEIGEGDLEHAIQLMKKHKAIEVTLERARTYGTIAHDALGVFRASPERDAMREVIRFCIARAH